MRVLLLFVVLLLCAGVSLSQNVDQDDVIRVETDVTNLPFTAIDKDHRFITNLRAEDVRVLEDGVPQTLFTFQQETDKPLAIAFLIDVSFSQESSLPESSPPLAGDAAFRRGGVSPPGAFVVSACGASAA